ncbi:MAG TPA: hypothetical protein VF933_09665 [Streptosporangiaceae bacterium]
MSDHTVIRFPNGQAPPPGYTDTAALNDIHAILCRPGRPAADALDDIALVLARCGRPLIDVLDIQAGLTETPAGLPEARVDAGPATVVVHQDRSGRLVIAATTTGETDLTVTLNQRQLHPAGGS